MLERPIRPIKVTIPEAVLAIEKEIPIIDVEIPSRLPLISEAKVVIKEIEEEEAS